jgi:hypothetical protein
MPSVGSFKAQPVTRTFVVTQNNNQGDQGPYFYSENDIATWVSANGNKIRNLGSLYIIPGTVSGATFLDVLTGNNGATALNHTQPNINERKNLVDLGKDVVIGNAVESRLLVLRKIQEFGTAANGGQGVIGYIVVENNADDLQGNTGRFAVRAARI